MVTRMRCYVPLIHKDQSMHEKVQNKADFKTSDCQYRWPLGLVSLPFSIQVLKNLFHYCVGYWYFRARFLNLYLFVTTAALALIQCCKITTRSSEMSNFHFTFWSFHSFHPIQIRYLRHSIWTNCAATVLCKFVKMKGQFLEVMIIGLQSNLLLLWQYSTKMWSQGWKEYGGPIFWILNYLLIKTVSFFCFKSNKSSSQEYVWRKSFSKEKLCTCQFSLLQQTSCGISTIVSTADTLDFYEVFENLYFLEKVFLKLQIFFGKY